MERLQKSEREIEDYLILTKQKLHRKEAFNATIDNALSSKALG